VTFVLIPHIADGLATFTMTRISLTISAVYNNCQNRMKHRLRRPKSFLVSGFRCRRKQLQNSPAAARGPPRRS